MYIIIYLLFLAIAAWVFISGIRKKSAGKITAGAIIALITAGFFWFMDFWGEKLWYESAGYLNRFGTEWITKFLLIVSGFIVSALLIYLLTVSIKKEKYLFRHGAALIGGIIGAFFWSSRWDAILRFIHKVPFNVEDPILNNDAGFYLFTLPLLNAIYFYLIYILLIALLVAFINILIIKDNRNIEIKNELEKDDPVFLNAGLLLIIIGAGRFLSRFELLYSELGVVTGPGWTDDKIRLPMLAVIGLVTILAGLAIVLPGIRSVILKRINSRFKNQEVRTTGYYAAGLFVIWFIFLVVVPFLFQWLKVEPNEITVERPYIENNIQFTRQGFDLEKVEENEFPVKEDFNRQMVNNNQDLLSNIRLWDYRALDAVFKQFQEIRLYYEFSDVDIDRYVIDSAYRQVMISAREMEIGNLPVKSQTFVNKRFKYTHGYGMVLTKVNEFTPEGLPNLLVKDIPPVSKYKSLEVTQPEIYYGELTDNHVIANSDEKEFDYPSGEENKYTHYKGSGGVLISNFWRKFLYGWKFDGTKLLLSGYPNENSRMMFHRNIRERINELAPFLKYDDDPYIVNANGKMYWIIDAYTTSQYYPYSEYFSSIENIGYNQNIYNKVGDQLGGKNYIRNSVKVVVNAYNGDVDYYIFDPEDPLVNVYNNMFPELFKTRDQMPVELNNHIRYPADMLLVQGLIYAKYHMTDPTVFYNQEDLWVRATEKYYNQVQPVEPYYIMWEPPGTDKTEFVLILPFTPKNKQVMIGWIAGMCDGENYGRFLAYKFPKEKRVLGTQQVETKIDQDSYLSGQLTLWDQRGSNVIRGNVLALPIEETIIYVEPIYLQSETAAYPELRLVAVMHNDNLSYAESFDKALEGLFGDISLKERDEEGRIIQRTTKQLIQSANKAFEDYLQLMNEKSFEEAGKALSKLENALNQLTDDKSPEQ
jgi:hypothetical protein